MGFKNDLDRNLYWIKVACMLVCVNLIISLFSYILQYL